MCKASVLPLEDIVEVVHAPNAAELFIAGLMDHKKQELVLLRGNMTLLVVPTLWFTTGVTGDVVPLMTQFSLIDYGQTLKFGEYEVSSDAVLYDFDPEYRDRNRSKVR